MNNEKSIFDTLSAIDIKNKTAKKGQFDYLPWAAAWREVVKKYPKAQFDNTWFDGKPFLKMDEGYFVQGEMTIDGLTHKQLMPVLDFKNKALMSPDVMDINKAIARALVKCAAKFGLGLDLWAGEDIDANLDELNAELKEKFYHYFNEGTDIEFAGFASSMSEDQWKYIQNTYEKPKTQMRGKVSAKISAGNKQIDYHVSQLQTGDPELIEETTESLTELEQKIVSKRAE